MVRSLLLAGAALAAVIAVPAFAHTAPLAQGAQAAPDYQAGVQRDQDNANIADAQANLDTARRMKWFHEHAYTDPQLGVTFHKGYRFEGDAWKQYEFNDYAKVGLMAPSNGDIWLARANHYLLVTPSGEVLDIVRR